MDKVFEMFDAWVKSQKDFMDNWVKAQREYLNSWMEATKNLQESFGTLGIQQEGPAKEMVKFYTSWVNNMVNSSRLFTDEAVRMQETWKNTMEKQMEMSKEMIKNFLEITKAGEKK